MQNYGLKKLNANHKPLMYSRISITSIICLIYSSALAQKNKFVIWNTLQLPVKLAEKWQLHNDISYRTLEGTINAYQFTFRTGIRYFIKPNLSATVGIAEFTTRTSFNKQTKELAKEFRVWQELNYEAKISTTSKLVKRLRIEERHFFITNIKSAYNALRLRYRFSFAKTFLNKWTATLSDEYMGQIIKGDYAFQQNRLGTSIAYQLSPKTQIQIGYIWSYLKNENIHYTTLSLQKSFY